MQKNIRTQECSSADMLADRQTYTHAHDNTHPPTRGEVTNTALHAVHSLDQNWRLITDNQMLSHWLLSNSVKRLKGHIAYICHPYCGSILKPHFCHDALYLTGKSAAPWCCGVCCLHSVIHFNGGNPQIVPSPWDTGWPILIHSCLGPLKSTTHLASQLVYGYDQQAQWSNDGVAAASSDGGPHWW